MVIYVLWYKKTILQKQVIQQVLTGRGLQLQQISPRAKLQGAATRRIMAWSVMQLTNTVNGYIRNTFTSYRHTAWCTSPYPPPRSVVGWCLAERLVNGDRRRCAGSGVACSRRSAPMYGKRGRVFEAQLLQRGRATLHDIGNIVRSIGVTQGYSKYTIEYDVLSSH